MSSRSAFATADPSMRYPPFGATWSSYRLIAKAAQKKSIWPRAEGGECLGRKMVCPVIGRRARLAA